MSFNALFCIVLNTLEDGKTLEEMLLTERRRNASPSKSLNGDDYGSLLSFSKLTSQSRSPYPYLLSRCRDGSDPRFRKLEEEPFYTGTRGLS